MNRRLIWGLCTIFLLIILYIGYSIWFDKEFKFDLSENESKVLLDSLKINDSLSLYWFQYETFVGNTTMSYIAIDHSACQVSQKNAIVRGEFILGIKRIKNDSIFILSSYGTEILKSAEKYHFIDILDSSNHQYIRHIQKELFFKDLCE